MATVVVATDAGLAAAIGQARAEGAQGAYAGHEVVKTDMGGRAYVLRFAEPYQPAVEDPRAVAALWDRLHGGPRDERLEARLWQDAQVEQTRRYNAGR